MHCTQWHGPPSTAGFPVSTIPPSPCHTPYLRTVQSCHYPTVHLPPTKQCPLPHTVPPYSSVLSLPYSIPATHQAMLSPIYRTAVQFSPSLALQYTDALCCPQPSALPFVPGPSGSARLLLAWSCWPRRVTTPLSNVSTEGLPTAAGHIRGRHRGQCLWPPAQRTCTTDKRLQQQRPSARCRSRFRTDCTRGQASAWDCLGLPPPHHTCPPPSALAWGPCPATTTATGHLRARHKAHRPSADPAQRRKTRPLGCRAWRMAAAQDGVNTVYITRVWGRDRAGLETALGGSFFCFKYTYSYEQCITTDGAKLCCCRLNCQCRRT